MSESVTMSSRENSDCLHIGDKSNEHKELSNGQSSGLEHGRKHKMYYNRADMWSSGCWKPKKKRYFKFSSEKKPVNESNQGKNDNKKSEEDCEIPGFYYDKEKKKYFRILPDQNRAISGSITKEVLQERQLEEKRQKDLYYYPKSRNMTSGRAGKKPACLCSDNNYHIIMACRLGLRSPLVSECIFRDCYMKRLLLRAKLAVSEQNEADAGTSEVEDVKKMIISPDATTLVSMWSVKGMTSQQLQQIHIKPTTRLDEDGNVSLLIRSSHPTHQLGIMKVTALCWAPDPKETEHTSRVLFTCTSLLENAKNVACLSNLDAQDDGSQVEYFSLGQSSWSCAWNLKGNQFTVGLETHSVLVDITTKKKLKLYTDSSAVYTMTISEQTGRIMYSGTRKGNIFTHDLRSHFARSVSDMNHKLGIAHIYLTSDESSLTASDVSGKIKTWDLRQRKVIMEYPGHINEYVRQPFFVDPAENFLFAVGQDCYTRIWNYRSGSLLHTIPAPHPVSVQSIPQIAYSEHMGGPRGLPGLLLTSKGEFHFYSI